MQISKIRYDGIRVEVINESEESIYGFIAVSGRPGAQNPRFMDVRDWGPIPEGDYVFSISRNWIWAGSNRTQVRGGENWPIGWGNYRVRLRPKSSTNTFGRDGFYLHGSRDGNGYGSAGCVDVNLMDETLFDVLNDADASELDFEVSYRSMLRHFFHPQLESEPNFDERIEATLNHSACPENVRTKMDLLDILGVPMDQYFRPDTVHPNAENRSRLA